MVKISILNECFLKEEHLNRLKKLGELTVYNDTNSEEKTINRLKDVDIVIADCYEAVFNKKVLDTTSKLKLVALNSAGYDVFDLEAARAKGIKVANAAGYATDGVAEHAIALMFSVIRSIPQLDRIVHETFAESNQETDEKFMGSDVRGKTMGILGLGRIGNRAAEIARGIGMSVVCYSRSKKETSEFEQVSLEELLKRSDVVSIHMALTPDTKYLLSEKEFSLMKPNAILINTARGKIINEQDLYNALKDKKIAAAGLDVLENWSKDNPLFSLENVVITPHVAFYTRESLKNKSNVIVSTVESFAAGTPINIVNP